MRRARRWRRSHFSTPALSQDTVTGQVQVAEWTKTQAGAASPSQPALGVCHGEESVGALDSVLEGRRGEGHAHEQTRGSCKRR